MPCGNTRSDLVIQQPQPSSEGGGETEQAEQPNHYILPLLIILALPVPESWECTNQITRTREIWIQGEEYLYLCYCVYV